MAVGIVRAGYRNKYVGVYITPRRIGYWNWKWQLEAMLDHKFDWNELDFVWWMYDQNFSTREAFIRYQRVQQIADQLMTVNEVRS